MTERALFFIFIIIAPHGGLTAHCYSECGTNVMNARGNVADACHGVRYFNSRAQ
jgi:hypothetical protein